jgi:hexosaminidase
MFKFKSLILIAFVFLYQITTATNNVPESQIIPQPDKVVMEKGSFQLTDNTRIVYQNVDSVKKIADFCGSILQQSFGREFKIENYTSKKSFSGSILFQLEKSNKSISAEAYTISIKSSNIVISSTSAQGLFNGLQTLRQLLPVKFEKTNSNPINWNVPCQTITDFPRFSYRGMHLDVCRHFFDKDYVEKFIDMMAMFKFNRFHWHLTEDQGWRIEIKKYPKLTSIGAFRTECDGSKYGGFYTQDDIREVVKYASDRFIEVIPEIEMPGHAVAALAAYPQFSCSGGPFKVETTWGVFHDVYCAGNDSVFTFLQNVLDEIIPLFPSKYIHIGGDECPKTRWQRCIKCQKRMQDEGLADEHALQAYFIRRIEKYLQPKGKNIIGWEEVLEGGVNASATIMSWRSKNTEIKAVKEGHQVIMSPRKFTYLNYPQGETTEELVALGKSKLLPLQKVYEFEPVPSELTNQEARLILGGQGCVWTEYIETPEKLEYLVFPRALALCEVLWSSSANRNTTFFNQKVLTHLDRLKNYGINFRPMQTKNK